MYILDPPSTAVPFTSYPHSASCVASTRFSTELLLSTRRRLPSSRNICTNYCAAAWTQRGGACRGRAARTSQTRRPAAPYTIWSQPSSERKVRRTSCFRAGGSPLLGSVGQKHKLAKIRYHSYWFTDKTIFCTKLFSSSVSFNRVRKNVFVVHVKYATRNVDVSLSKRLLNVITIQF